MRKITMTSAFLGILTLILAATSLTILAAPAAQTAGPCAGAPAPRLSAGIVAQPAQVYSTLWVHPTQFGIRKIMFKSFGDTFTVNQGPLCFLGMPYNWYEVTHKGQTGWVTEGTGSTYWIQAVTQTPTPTPTPDPDAGSAGPCAGAPAPRLTVGGTGSVAHIYSTLWRHPGSGSVLDRMYKANNDTFTVLAGPTCFYGKPYNWYQVTHNGQTGWITEGTGSTYWVQP